MFQSQPKNDKNIRVYEVTVSNSRSADGVSHYKVWEKDDASMDAHFKEADEKGLRFFSLTDARGKKVWNIDLWQGWRFKTTVSWKKYVELSKPPLPPGPPPLKREDFPSLTPSRNSPLFHMSPTRQHDVEEGEVLPPPPGPLSFSRQVSEVLPPPPGPLSFSRQVSEVLPPPPGPLSFSRQVSEVLPPPPGPVSLSREDTQGGNMSPPPPRPPKLKRTDTETGYLNDDHTEMVRILEEEKKNLIDEFNAAGLKVPDGVGGLSD